MMHSRYQNEQDALMLLDFKKALYLPTETR